MRQHVGVHPECLRGPLGVTKQLQDTRELEIHLGIVVVELDRQRELFSRPVQLAGTQVNVGQPPTIQR